MIDGSVRRQKARAKGSVFNPSGRDCSFVQKINAIMHSHSLFVEKKRKFQTSDQSAVSRTGMARLISTKNSPLWQGTANIPPAPWQKLIFVVSKTQPISI